MLKDKTLETKLNELFSEWQQMDRNSPDASKAALTFYDEQIFPLVKEVFLGKPTNRPDKEYDVLILTVGFSPEPLILSIRAIEHKRVALLYTKETAKFLPRIQDETNLPLNHLAMREIDGSSTVEVYETIMELYTKWSKPKNIAVDITGGKKSMVGGAAMAGAALGADIYYVDNTSFILGKPEPGSEYLSLLDNPYTVFGDLEVEKARDLYERHDYAGAQRIFNQLEAQVRDPNLITVYRAYGFLCEIYEAWDNLDISRARTNVDHLLNILERFSPSVNQLEPLYSLMPILSEHKKALEGLDNIFNNEKLAFNIPDGFHFAFMLYHNALRRKAQGKLDTACLLLYRLLEWIEQHRLAQYGIITSDPNYSKSDVDEIELFDKYKKKRKDVYGNVSMSDLPNPIALVDGFLTLGALDDDIVDGLNWQAFRGQVEIRNRSIYAHGMSKINEKSFNAFKATVEGRFKKAQEITDTDINADAFNDQHKFIAPLP
ncbi:TIGR02710 family CRISPR-associated protein [Candidatus Poribacteria bacterium]|nr:TIGR02710 family CRISPR-associated protein [Candidatus Poribacteria bacterium]